MFLFILLFFFLSTLKCNSAMEIHNPPRLGFADDNFVMIHGNYYRTNDVSNENRRPILLLAWYTEFADVLLKNTRLGLTEEIRRELENKGAADIVKQIAGFLRISFSVFTRPWQSTFEERRNRDRIVSTLYLVKGIRNCGTHKKIQNSNWLKEMLEEMIHLCTLLRQLGMENDRSEIFEEECWVQLENLLTFNNLY